MGGLAAFLSPLCGGVYALPAEKAACACGFTPACRQSVYQLCDDPPLRLADDAYIGYDAIGEDFEPNYLFWGENRYAVYDACAELTAKLLGPGSAFLDLGAGLGTASIPLARGGLRVIAGDISDVMLQTATRRAGGRYPNLVLTRMNAYSLPLADASMDSVVENALLHLVSAPERIIAEVLRVLKPGGILILFSLPGLPLSGD